MEDGGCRHGGRRSGAGCSPSPLNGERAGGRGGKNERGLQKNVPRNKIPTFLRLIPQTGHSRAPSRNARSPLIPFFSPTGGEGARRAVEGEGRCCDDAGTETLASSVEPAG